MKKYIVAKLNNVHEVIGFTKEKYLKVKDKIFIKVKIPNYELCKFTKTIMWVEIQEIHDKYVLVGIL